MGKRIKAPLAVGTESRHITLRTLNQAIAPDFEVRVCIDSNGSDTLAFLPMSSADWATVESQYGQRVAEHFRKIEEKPNLFTDRW
jgi:hypothetical protein